jgi:hypothetical protein
MAKAPEAQMILIAGPHRSGTNDDPALIKKNVRHMESYTLPVFRARTHSNPRRMAGAAAGRIWGIEKDRR